MLKVKKEAVYHCSWCKKGHWYFRGKSAALFTTWRISSRVWLITAPPLLVWLPPLKAILSRTWLFLLHVVLSVWIITSLISEVWLCSFHSRKIQRLIESSPVKKSKWSPPPKKTKLLFGRWNIAPKPVRRESDTHFCYVFNSEMYWCMGSYVHCVIPACVCFIKTAATFSRTSATRTEYCRRLIGQRQITSLPISIALYIF